MSDSLRDFYAGRWWSKGWPWSQHPDYLLTALRVSPSSPQPERG